MTMPVYVMMMFFRQPMTVVVRGELKLVQRITENMSMKPNTQESRN